MELLIISSDPAATDWVEETSGKLFNILLEEKFSQAETIIKNYGITNIIADLMVDSELLSGKIRTLKKVNKNAKIYARVTASDYTTSIHELLLKYGVKGLFLDWPSRPILAHELISQNGITITTHPVYGEIVLNGEHVMIGKTTVRLTKKERAVFNLILKAGAEGISREELLESTGYRADSNTHTIETHIYRLRIKLKDNGFTDVIQNESWTKGYIINSC